ncbi:MAG: response regulator [Mariprofundaceae bacterium]
MFHVIDDQPHIHEFVSSVLDSIGYESICFSCPAEYLSYLSSPEFQKPLAVITDITMPIMNGYGLINQISELNPNLKFVVMTGEPHIHSPYKHKACMYLSKPFKPEKLMQIVHTIVLCESSAPSCEHECGEVADKKDFSITNWRCPKVCTTCDDGC